MFKSCEAFSSVEMYISEIPVKSMTFIYKCDPIYLCSFVHVATEYIRCWQFCVTVLMPFLYQELNLKVPFTISSCVLCS